jgi:hypothetical protein
MSRIYKTTERQRIAAAAWQEMNRNTRLNITTEHYGAMMAEQNGVCAICKDPPKKNRLHIDHNHLTGRVRGLLCIRCNITLGNLEKYKDQYLAYLERWK